MVRMTLNITGIMLEGLKKHFSNGISEMLSNSLNRHIHNFRTFLKGEAEFIDYIGNTDQVSISTIISTIFHY